MNVHIKMKKQFLLFFSLIITVFFYACDKGDDPISNSGSNETDNENKLEKVTGYFTSTYIVATASAPIPPPIPSGTQLAEAKFYRSLQDSVAIAADSVTVNNLLLNKTTAGLSNYHSLSSQANPDLNMKRDCYWKVVDTSYSEIPDMAFNDPTPYPNITGFLPDTGIIKTGFSVNNLSIIGADSFTVMLQADMFNPTKLIQKTYPAGTTFFSFSYDEIKNVTPSASTGLKNGFIVIAYRSNIFEREGRYYKVTKQTLYYSGIWIEKE